MVIRVAVCAGAVLCAATAFAQNSSAREATQADALSSSSNGPAAYVYVTSTPAHGNVNEIMGYEAAQDGKLTPVSGSPFAADETSVAVSGTYLFASNRNGIYLDSYHIEANGSLTYSTSTDILKSASQCANSGAVFLDHTAATLYNLEFNDDGCANNDYRSFSLDKVNGSMKSVGASVGNSWLSLPATFIGNDKYAYTASCLGDMYWGIWGYVRESNGLLTDLAKFSAPVPKPPSGDFYCPSQAAADPTNHVAISMQAVDGQTFNPAGAPQIASFTAAANGNLSTTNTSADMPKLIVVNVTALNMAPSGKLLAVAGTGGLEVLHFNGASPATKYTGLLTKDEIDQMYWDKANHLYAISTKAGKLFVFTVTPTGYVQAPGSPYTVSDPHDVMVLPLPLPWEK